VQVLRQSTKSGWPLQNVILKRVTEDHRTVFQLQFEWDSLVGGQARDHKHVSKGKEHKVKARRRSGKGSNFTHEEDALLADLKRDDRRLSWHEIHEQFTSKFPGRSRGALQVRYSTKLKGG
jgi:hypothetical protein